jgi:predicted amidohydrolase
VSAPEAKPLRLGLLQYAVGRPADVDAFGRALEARIEAGRMQADLLVLPEYACVELGAALAGGDATDEAGELAAMVAAAPAIEAVMRQAARRQRVWLLPGSMPVRAADGRIVNRAPLIAPDGRMAFQDKRAMTRFETERWGVCQGADPNVFDTPWGRIGISVCYDVEFPKHVRVQVQAGAWLILAPSCTDTVHGFNRVRIGAAARAMENQCYVAITPTVGAAPWSAALDVNRGHAAVFGPVDRGFPESGVLARGTPDREEWVFCTIDPARIAAVREDGQVRNHRDWPTRPFVAPAPAEFA